MKTHLSVSGQQSFLKQSTQKVVTVKELSHSQEYTLLRLRALLS